MKIVVIIPTYNERDNIKKTILELQRVFNNIKNHNLHILVVDDTSPDKTADVVRGLIKKFPNVHLKLRKEKEGLGAAIFDGMDYAFNTMKADAIVKADADLSHDLNVISKFVEHLEGGVQYVCGTRYRKGGGIPPEWGLHRKLLSFGGNLFVRLLYIGSGLSDFTSGFQTFTKKVYDDIKDSIGVHSGYTFAISMNLEPIRYGYKAIEVPYHFKDRTAGKSKMGAGYFVNAFVFVVKSRIQDFVNTRFGKVFVAGGVGGILQLLTYTLFFYPLIERKNILGLPVDMLIERGALHPRFLMAQLLSIEVGLFTSYSVNNKWSFRDKELNGMAFYKGFFKTNVVASGAIIIQVLVGQFFSYLFGVGFVRGNIYQVLGILVGLIWNFYFYKKVIWRVKK